MATLIDLDFDSYNSTLSFRIKEEINDKIIIKLVTQIEILTEELCPVSIVIKANSFTAQNKLYIISLLKALMPRLKSFGLLKISLCADHMTDETVFSGDLQTEILSFSSENEWLLQKDLPV